MFKKLILTLALLVFPTLGTAQTAIDLQPAPTTIEQVGALADPGIHNIDNAHVYGWTGTAWSPSDAAGIHPIINAHLYTWDGSTWNPASTSSVTISNVGSSTNTQILYNGSGSVNGDANLIWTGSPAFLAVGPTITDSTNWLQPTSTTAMQRLNSTKRYGLLINHAATTGGGWSINALQKGSCDISACDGIESDVEVTDTTGNGGATGFFSHLAVGPGGHAFSLSGFTAESPQFYDGASTADFIRGITIEDQADQLLGASFAIDIQNQSNPSTNYALRTGSGRVFFGDDVALSYGKALKGTSDNGDTWLLQAYDTNTGPGYVTFGTFTNGPAPSFVLSPPAGGATIDITANNYTMTGTTQVFAGSEVTPPAAPAANGFKMYAQDNGSGKTQVCVLFNSGSSQCFASEP